MSDNVSKNGVGKGSGNGDVQESEECILHSDHG